MDQMLPCWTELVDYLEEKEGVFWGKMIRYATSTTPSYTLAKEKPYFLFLLVIYGKLWSYLHILILSLASEYNDTVHRLYLRISLFFVVLAIS